MQAMMKDAGILFAITLIAGLLLGLVNMVTAAPIKEQEELARVSAFQEVFADAVDFPSVDADGATSVILADFPMQQIDEVVEAKDASGNTLGYVVTVTTKEGYGGNIQFALGIRNDGTLNGMSILSIAETAGLGMRADEVLKPQFAGKNVETFTYVKGGAASGDDQINAISGATITTNAVTNGVNAGLFYFREVLQGNA
ncbi:MAG: RnfABCDGE type electron transport complex subunit G [Lachnospiraceae bacterium]|nr:RnfABCDGE type electron transport complex subunit G [Lachnospiraceae bacterium]